MLLRKRFQRFQPRAHLSCVASVVASLREASAAMFTPFSIILRSFGQNGCQESSGSSKCGGRNLDPKDIGEFLCSRIACCKPFAFVIISKLVIVASSEILNLKDGGCIFGRMVFIMEAISCGRLGTIA